MRTPGFTVVAVIVLALGIGANSAIFSLVSAVWLKPLPFADAERLTDLRVVISEGFWLRRLAGDPAAVGRTIDLDGSPHMVVGVVPRDFRFPEGDNGVFIPTASGPEVLARYQSFYWHIVAKLRAGEAEGTRDPQSPRRGSTGSTAARLSSATSSRNVSADISPTKAEPYSGFESSLLIYVGRIAKQDSRSTRVERKVEVAPSMAAT